MKYAVDLIVTKRWFPSSDKITGTVMAIPGPMPLGHFRFVNLTEVKQGENEMSKLQFDLGLPAHQDDVASRLLKVAVDAVIVVDRTLTVPFSESIRLTVPRNTIVDASIQDTDGSGNTGDAFAETLEITDTVAPQVSGNFGVSNVTEVPDETPDGVVE
jgi:hypothetical protein